MMKMKTLDNGREKCVTAIKSRLQDHATTTDDIPSVGTTYLDHLQYVTELMTKTVYHGESNSALLIGPPGSGKSRLVAEALKEQRRENEFVVNSKVISLDGLVHSDDRLTLRDITRQLRMQDEVEAKAFNSISETFTFLLEELKRGSRDTSISLIFILEHFDSFCLHRNQSLIYNLFDVAQSAQTPVMVLGVTCRLDVIELLEKRVKSRFSHRQLFLFPDLPFADYYSVFTSLLLLPDDFQPKALQRQWNADVKELSSKSEVREALKRLFFISKELRVLKSVMMSWLCRRSELSSDALAAAVNSHCTDANVSLLNGLSVLQFCLVIAMNHLEEIYDGEPFNFQMVYRQYHKFVERKASVQGFDKAVVLKAYEELVALEVILPIDKSSLPLKEYRLHSLSVNPSQIKEAVNSNSGLPTDVKQWAGSSLA